MKSTKPRNIRKKWTLGNFETTFQWKSSKELMGRFGGGWNWKVGFQIGSTTIIFNVLVFTIRMHYVSKREREGKQLCTCGHAMYMHRSRKNHCWGKGCTCCTFMKGVESVTK